MSAPSPPPSPARRLDLTPLTAPLAEAELSAFVADSKASGKPWRVMTTGARRPGVSDVAGQLVPALVPLVGLGFFLWIGRWSLVEAVWEFTLEAPFPLNLVIVAVVALVLVAALLAVVHVIRLVASLRIPRIWWETAYRLVGFAAANDLRYGHDEQVAHPGVIFLTGQDRVAERRLTTTAGRPLEIGNYRYAVQGENDEQPQVHHWGYVAITLDRRLPHLLLDAKANNRSTFGIKTSNLPVDLAPDQRLALGGEFDEHFTLYAPDNYGRDAFGIFTPDLMALFIDRLGTYDVEIIDDTLFVYGSPFDLLAPRTYAWLQEVVATVVARTVRRTERYRDDFALLESGPDTSSTPAPSPPVAAAAAAAKQGVPDPERPVFALGGDAGSGTATNRVAEQGRRLRRRRWGPAAVLGLLVVAYWVYDTIVAPLFGLPVLPG
ncbi:hypothetical protein [uncultured Friedmanniella sp.]|uniref:hypothetical protein n=1 Tax=uncultured Friedmanniella sp. TaxID=335381 RepID=UPI0035C9F6EC